jgi:hypothetical protein
LHFTDLQEAVRQHTGRFTSRRQAAEATVLAAAAGLPKAEVEAAVDGALQLGVPGKQLAAALEVVRTRDATAAARLSAVAEGVLQQAKAVLLGEMQNYSLISQSNGGHSGPSVSLHEFNEAAAQCMSFGLKAQVSAAKAALHDIRQEVAASLATAASSDQRRSPAAVQGLLAWGKALGGLEHQVQVAESALQQQSAMAAQQLMEAVATYNYRSPGCSVSHLQNLSHLLQQAVQLGVPTETVATAQHYLAVQHESILTELDAAATAGTLGDFGKTLNTAQQLLQLDPSRLQKCRKLFANRRSSAVAQLVDQAASCCAAAFNCASPALTADIHAMMQMTSEALLGVQSPAGGGHCTRPAAGSAALSLSRCPVVNNVLADHQQRLTARAMAFTEQVQICKDLGLQQNSSAALQAVLDCCRSWLWQGELL